MKGKSFESPENHGNDSDKVAGQEAQPKIYSESALWERIVQKDREMREASRKRGEIAIDSEPLREAMLARMIENLEKQGHTVTRDRAKKT